MAFLGVDLVVLRVRNLAQAEAFYSEKFGVRVGPGVHETSRTLFLAGGPHVDLMQRPPGSRQTTASAPVELRMVVDDLEATYQGFVERDVEIVHPPTKLPGGGREMMAADLDGYLWRFIEPRRPHT